MLSVHKAEGLRGSELAEATLGQIRLVLFKITARIKVSRRCIHFELASAYPYRGLFEQACSRLGMLPTN